MNSWEALAPMVVTIAMFLGIGWMVRITSNNKRLDKLAKMQADLQIRVLDKLGSSQDVLAYVTSEAGKRLFEPPVGPEADPTHRSPYARILLSTQTGIVLALGGGGFLLGRGLVTGLDDTGFAFLGVLGLALGVGFLASAVAAHILAKSYGLIDGAGVEGRQ